MKVLKTIHQKSINIKRKTADSSQIRRFLQLKKYTNYIGFKTMPFKIAIINISLSVITFSLQSNRCNSKPCLPLA